MTSADRGSYQEMLSLSGTMALTTLQRKLRKEAEEIAEIAKVDFFGTLIGIGMTPSGAPLPPK